MFKVLLVDDEPLVLVGLQGMLDWNELGWEVVGTARNGKDALALIEEKLPDLVLCDIKMPVMGGLALAKRCQELDLGLPVFIMLTSFEEFDYVRQSMNLGVLEYRIKLELTPHTLETALRRAENRIQRERALRAPGSASLSPAGGLIQYRERFFLQLYGGFFEDRNEFCRLCGDFGLSFDAPYYVAALGVLKNDTKDSRKLASLSAAITNMAADIMPKYVPCTVTGMDLRHFCVLFPLSSLVGVCLAVSVLKRGGIWLACGFHTAWNFVQGSLYGLAVSGGASTMSLLSFEAASENSLLTGGAFGLEASIFTTLVLAVVLVFLLALEPADRSAEPRKSQYTNI